MEGVVVRGARESVCKRFAIKGNGICDRSARGFDGHKAKLHSFFSLRTIRVVTDVSASLRKIPSGFPTIRELFIARNVGRNLDVSTLALWCHLWLSPSPV